MTDNEIIKALRCCADKGCKFCSEQGKPYCRETVASLAWDLIYRQKAENERYREVVGELAVAEDGTVTGLLNGKETKFIDKEVAETFKRFAVSEARKEFAERLEDRISDKLDRSLDNPDGNNYSITDVFADINDLLEEMEERV